MPNIPFSGSEYDDLGVGINGATVNLYDFDTTTPVRATTTTNSSGYWTISHATEGRFDVEIVNGTSKRRRKYTDEVQLRSVEVANLRVRNPAFTFKYDIVPAAITADRTLNLPLITGTDTFAPMSLVSAKGPCRVATTANITLSGEQTIDGVLTAAQRVLVKNQTTGAENGIYVSAAGAWTRAEDFNTSEKVLSGVIVPVSEGTVGADTLWILTTNAPITLGTTPLAFSQFGTGTVTAVTGTAPIASSGGTTPAISLNDDGVTNAKLANVPTATFKGRTSESTGDPEDLTAAQATALLNAATATLKGLVPTPPNNTTTFLRGDATFAAPGGGTAPVFDRVVRTAGSITTTSTTLVDVTGATITFTTGAFPVQYAAAQSAQNDTAGQTTSFNVDVDGTLLHGTDGLSTRQDTGGGYLFDASFSGQTAALTAAAHTIKLQWMVTANTGTIRASSQVAHMWSAFEIR